MRQGAPLLLPPAPRPASGVPRTTAHSQSVWLLLTAVRSLAWHRTQRKTQVHVDDDLR